MVHYSIAPDVLKQNQPMSLYIQTVKHTAGAISVVIGANTLMITNNTIRIPLETMTNTYIFFVIHVFAIVFDII